ncbi:hypothetical protein GUJ93_ZPchr0007g3023 [Zizania palustris]|uniref:Uncharacterized protein n=1 Tax=Zizania palustris TaxID=103762 RepID=A0A8J5SNS9_ZIZPA|nr:hypothetical protein GUJ93_ZPchr0007g3023 [Zizania palustris]
MPATSRVVLEVLRAASRDAFQVVISFAVRPPVSTMVKPAIASADCSRPAACARGGEGGRSTLRSMVPSRAEEYYGQHGDGDQAPRGLLLPAVAVALALAIVGPQVLGEGAGEKFAEAVKEAVGPVRLLLLPLCLIVVIHLLSSDRSAAVLANVFSFGASPHAVPRVGGSPVGVALLLFLVLMLLYYRSSSLLRGEGGGGE